MALEYVQVDHNFKDCEKLDALLSDIGTEFELPTYFKL